MIMLHKQHRLLVTCRQSEHRFDVKPRTRPRGSGLKSTPKTTKPPFAESNPKASSHVKFNRKKEIEMKKGRRLECYVGVSDYLLLYICHLRSCLEETNSGADFFILIRTGRV